MRYTKGYKYLLNETYQRLTPIKPENDIKTAYIELTTYGRLTVMKSYSWDGASGPTFDTKSSMEGALEHDALCQLMREGHLYEKWFPAVNRHLKNKLIADGMWKWRARLWYRAVNTNFAKAIALKKKRIYSAP